MDPKYVFMAIICRTEEATGKNKQPTRERKKEDEERKVFVEDPERKERNSAQ